jgi:uncharacterized membrane protein
MASALLWWLLSLLFAVLALPLTWRLFSRLPDRGYGFSRAVGILGSGYVFWLGGSLHLLHTDLGAGVGSVLLVAAVSAWAGAGRWGEIKRWLRENWRTVAAMEALFLAAFVLWSAVRAYNPDIAATEKPMELGFLNSVLRSSRFPPADPWLSGYAISYYYFGYVLLGLSTKLTGVSAGIGFNLGNALWFALTALGSYSLLFNLLTLRDGRPRWKAALLGPLFVLLVGNLEGFLEILHARHVFWGATPGGNLSSAFWRWLNIEHLSDPPVGDPTWRPSRYLWWWQASRVVRDVNLQGVPIGIQPIDEFPYFSFLLADNHPHLLALPFVLLAVGFCLQVHMRGEQEPLVLRWLRIRGSVLRRGALTSVGVLMAAAVARSILLRRGGATGAEAVSASLRGFGLWAAGLGLLIALILALSGRLPIGLHKREFLFAAWLFGALAFLNFWDFPIYLALLLAVVAWAGRRSDRGALGPRMLGTAFGLGVVGVGLYFPWYPSFSSQAGGLLPNLVFTTRPVHFLVIFGPAFIPIAYWVTNRILLGLRGRELRALAVFTMGIPVALTLVSWILGGVVYFALQSDPGTFEAALALIGVGELGSSLVPILVRRLTTSWTSLILAAVISAGGILLWRKLPRSRVGRRGEGASSGEDVFPFVILLIGIGALLMLGPEFVYLRDLFGVRINTVFKLYFAGWVLWGVSAAYLVTEILPWRSGMLLAFGALVLLGPEMMAVRETSQAAGQQLFSLYLLAWVVWGVGEIVLLIRSAARNWPPGRTWLAAPKLLVVLPMLLGLFYPLQATLTKTNNFTYPEGPTLDGTAHLARFRAADSAAIQWINQNLPRGVIAEAVGGSYTDFGRISAHTGFPTVLGWEFHEVQWRGSAETQGTRAEDIRKLYMTSDWGTAQSIIQRYHISYIYAGNLEQTSYNPMNLEKFENHLETLYQTQDVQIFGIPNEWKGGHEPAP